jgi:hypothetical protein
MDMNTSSDLFPDSYVLYLLNKVLCSVILLALKLAHLFLREVNSNSETFLLKSQTFKVASSALSRAAAIFALAFAFSFPNKPVCPGI